MDSYLHQVANTLHLLGGYFYRRAQSYCYVYHLRRNWDPKPQGCTLVSWLLFPCLGILFPFLISDCSNLLLWDSKKLIEAGVYSLQTEMGDRSGLCPGSPQCPGLVSQDLMSFLSNNALPVFSCFMMRRMKCIYMISLGEDTGTWVWLLMGFSSSFPFANFNLYSNLIKHNHENNSFPEFCESFWWIMSPEFGLGGSDIPQLFVWSFILNNIYVTNRLTQYPFCLKSLNYFP